MKLVLKILALPVLFVVKVICILGNLLTNVVSYVIGLLIQRQQMRNFCFPNGSISILPADSRRTISSHTRYASPLSREKSPRKKRTKSAMKQRCDGQRENTLSSLRPTSTNPTFTIISFIIRPRWMPHGNSKTSFFPVWRCKDSVIWFAWNTGCPLLHRSRIGSARKELFIPRSVPSGTTRSFISTLFISLAPAKAARHISPNGDKLIATVKK